MSTTGYAYAFWQSKKYCYTSIPEVNARLERTVQSGVRGDRIKYEKGALEKGSDARASIAPTKNPSKVEGVVIFGNRRLGEDSNFSSFVCEAFSDQSNMLPEAFIIDLKANFQIN